MVEETYFFNEGQTVITVGGEEFQVYKRGPERAAQFGKLTAWLGTYALSGLLMANEAGVIGDTNDVGDISRLLSFILSESVSGEALIELGAIMLGSEYEFAAEHFDEGWFIEMFVITLSNPGLRRAFSRVWEMFFLAGGEGELDEADQAQD